MNIGDLLDRTAISTRVSAANKKKALAVIAEIAARNFGLDAGDVLDALTERELAGSTGVGHGVAVPHARLEETGILAIAGKAPLTVEMGRLLPRKVFRGVSMVMAARGQSCILHVMEFPWTRNTAPKAGIGSSDAELIANWPGLLFDNTSNYIIWGFSAAAPRFPADVMQRRGGDLMELVLGMTGDWSPNFRSAVTLIGGTIMPGETDLAPDRNSVQSLAAVRRDGAWRLARLHNSRAEFVGRPKAAAALTEELRRLV